MGKAIIYLIILLMVYLVSASFPNTEFAYNACTGCDDELMSLNQTGNNITADNFFGDDFFDNGVNINTIYNSIINFNNLEANFTAENTSIWLNLTKAENEISDINATFLAENTTLWNNISTAESDIVTTNTFVVNLESNFTAQNVSNYGDFVNITGDTMTGDLNVTTAIYSQNITARENVTTEGIKSSGGNVTIWI